MVGGLDAVDFADPQKAKAYFGGLGSAHPHFKRAWANIIEETIQFAHLIAKEVEGMDDYENVKDVLAMSDEEIVSLIKKKGVPASRLNWPNLIRYYDVVFDAWAVDALSVWKDRLNV